MTLPVRLAASSLLVLLASCADGPDDLVEDSVEVGQQRQSLFNGTTTPTWCSLPGDEGGVTVTVHHDGVYGGTEFTPCALLDGDYGPFAIITYNEMRRLKVDMRFDQKRKLSGFHTILGGLDGRPSEYSVTVAAVCDEGVISFPRYLFYTGARSALSFGASCTTDFVSLGVSRDSHDGVEHIPELAPVFVDENTPTTGDRISMLTSSGVCDQVTWLKGADILSTASGSAVGKVHLFRARCTQSGTTTPVYVYYAKSISSVGSLPDMDFMSTFVQYTTSANMPRRQHKTVMTLQSPTNGTVVSNVWVADPGTEVLTVSACARYYPSNQSLTSDATATGCTAAVTLP